MIFFIFLGNKYIGYLIYFLPILVFYTFNLNKNKYISIFLKILIILFIFYNGYRIKNHLSSNLFRKELIETVKKEVSKDDYLYANFKFEPYLVDHCKFLTLAEKESEFFIKYNSLLNSSYVLDQQGGILENMFLDKIKVIHKYDNNYILFKISKL